MKLKDIKNAFSQNQIEKSAYIDQMYNIHEVLFDYSEFIKNTDIQKIEISDNRVILTTKEDSIKLIAQYPDKRMIPIEILNFSFYEREALDFLKKIIKPESIMFDIGGNVGWYTINLKKNKPGLTVYTFEPIPKTFAILKENCLLNNISIDNLYNMGFSEEDKEVEFYFYPEGSGNSSMVNLTENPGVVVVKSLVQKIDTFVKQKNISIDFMKIDVEGAELFVLKGGLETIKKDTPVIFTEMLRKWSFKFNYHPNEIIELLNKIGYKCFILQNERLKEFYVMDESTTDTNFIFLHVEKHKSIIKEWVF